MRSFCVCPLPLHAKKENTNTLPVLAFAVSSPATLGRGSSPGEVDEARCTSRMRAFRPDSCAFLCRSSVGRETGTSFFRFHQAKGLPCLSNQQTFAVPVGRVLSWGAGPGFSREGDGALSVSLVLASGRLLCKGSLMTQRDVQRLALLSLAAGPAGGEGVLAAGSQEGGLAGETVLISLSLLVCCF